jgi:hemolysin activation/secretion protein
MPYSFISSSPDITRRANTIGRLIGLLVLLASSTVWAQRAPDAGLLLREQLKTAPKLPERSVPAIQRDESVAPVVAEPGSVQFVLASIRISGNSAFTEPELLALLQDMIGRPVGFAELDAAAARISHYYRGRGYMVARAYLPAQDIVDGVVRIAVVEGHFGEFELYNTSHVLGSLLRDRLDELSGDIIQAPELERTLLLLDDLPGVGAVHATLRPGADSGESDVVVDVEKEPFISGSLEGDNFGNRYVGANQVTAKLRVASPYRLGEAWGVQFTRSDDEMTFQRLSYQLPVGDDGFELGAGYIASKYRLGEQFAVLDASGDSTSYTLNASYPFVRASNFSLYGRVLQAWREFEDRTLDSAVVDNKSSQATTLLLNGNAFDDTWGGGGTTFALAYTSGNLDIETPLARSIDSATARTQGQFDKWNLQLLRVQNLGDRTSAYLSFTGQKAGGNLDSSEKFILGGANGVRAYPQGEAPGDSGYVATAELRYQFRTNSTLGTLQSFLLVDAGAITASEDPFAAGSNHRHLSAYGVGIAWFGANDLVVKLTAAQQLGNEPALSDDDKSTRFWAQVGWYF